MKKRIIYFSPLGAGLAAFAFYELLYSPMAGSEDFITALLTFFAMLGWCGVIIFTKEKQDFLLYFHMAAAILIPLSMPLYLHVFNLWEHMAIIFLMLISLSGLHAFVHSYFQRKNTD